MAEFAVIQTYRKDLVHQPGHGYGRKSKGVWVATRGVTASSELVHTTNNARKGTKFWAEATFLRDSPDVSCHDFIGKDGTIAEILPDTMLAWHSGAALMPFLNTYSIGTELHVSVGEAPTQAQKDALAWRIQQRRQKYGITRDRIDTHRAAALPRGRKQDPEGWSDEEFYAWRDSLFVVTGPDFASMFAPFPYVEHYGIPTAYRAWHTAGKSWGKALTKEEPFNGGTIQQFEKAVVTWTPDGGVSVYTIGKL